MTVKLSLEWHLNECLNTQHGLFPSPGRGARMAGERQTCLRRVSHFFRSPLVLP